MIEALKKAVEGMRQHLVLAGVGERSIDAVLKDGLDHATIFDSVQGLAKHEYRRLQEVWLLQPASTWAYYEARGIEELRELKMLKGARRDLRNAWRNRVAVFAKKEGQYGEARP